MIESKQIRNPFPGLRPFETNEYRLFFGREGQSDELLSRLQRSRFLAVVGTSGSGKSSLIRAGLMPALHGGMMEGAGAGWRIAVMRPGGDPIGNLAAELAKKDVLSDAGAGLRSDEAEALIDATLRSSSLGIVNVAYQGRLGEHEKLLIVVDQFEELFRFRAAREGASAGGDEAAAFVKLLLEAAQQRELSIYVVLTMRSDFLGDCAQFQGLPEAINDGQYLIPRMTRDERRFAVTGPVGVTRGKIAEPLVNRLLNDVGDQPDQLPILQHALMRTWEHWRTMRRNGEPIGIEHYEAIGTMSEALSRHADEAFDELPDERSRQIAEKLFKCLSERGADNRETRRPTRLDAICEITGASMKEVIAVVDVFREGGRSFVMPPIDTVLQPETVIDISHESLIRNWQRLKGWVIEEAQSARIYRRLAETAVLHREGSEGLLQDPYLQVALDWRDQNKPNAEWAKRYHPEYETAITYLDDSRKERETRIAAAEKRRNEEIERDKRELEQTKAFVAQQARSARWMRALIAALCLILLLSIGTAAYAFRLRAVAENSRHEAEDSKLFAEAAAEAAKNANELALQQRESALRSAERAINAQAQMEIEQQKAKDAAIAADTQRDIALVNLRAAQIATQKAEAATKIALENDRETIAALERGELVRVGLESFRREDFDRAREAFEKLEEKLKPFQTTASNSGHFTPEQSKKFARDYGWTLSRLGETHHRLRDFEKAIEAYQGGRVVLEDVLKDQPAAILFETYHGLAHSYHDNAIFRSSAVLLGPSRITLTPEEQLEKAEEFYKKAAAHQELLKSGNHLAAANSYKNLARLYIDTRKYDLAEQSLKKVVEAHRMAEGTPGPSTVGALKELAEFYNDQTRYQDAATAYNELIDIQEKINLEDNEATLRALSDSYSDLGQIYYSLKDKRGDYSFQLADKIQQVALKFKSLGGVKEALLKEDETFDDDFDALGDIYLKLGRFQQGGEAYETALGIREEVKSKNRRRAFSYLKLAHLYRDHFNNSNKAEEYYKLLIADLKDTGGRLFGPNDPLSQYVAALRELATLYAGDLNKPAEAATLLNTALSKLSPIAGRLAWLQEQQTYTVLVGVSKQHRPDKLEQIHTSRVELLQKRRADFAAVGYRTEDYPLFLIGYVKAIGEAADFYLAKNDQARAEATYRSAFSNQPEIGSRLRTANQLDNYASTLEKYQLLLRDLKKNAEAAKLDEPIKQARARQKEFEKREKETQQPTQPAPLEELPTTPKP
jgi:tetratricopeptide (TPR) repeat protein